MEKINIQKQIKPIIAIPIGDCAGIGPEIVVKALEKKQVNNMANCVVVGDSNVLNQIILLLNSTIKINIIENIKDAIFQIGILNLLDLKNIDICNFTYGEVSSMCGKSAFEFIEKSISLALSGAVDAVCTTPINKESLKKANIPFIGHTEIFASLTNTKDPLTMFQVQNLKIFFLTRHLSLKNACSAIKKDRIIDYVKRSIEMLKNIGVNEGTMAIAGLNPHSGEHGLFGDEELIEIIPAIDELQKSGYKIAGPIGADSVFHLANSGKFNSVLSLYHDQGHIAAKTLDFEKTITITGGMPILRTSVDHGTAFDIAGKGIASEVSLIEAIKLASEYAKYYNKLT